MTLFDRETVLQKIQLGYSFKQAELSRLNLESANIDEAVFSDAYMRGANS
ncbi:MAG: pentapeptide repeat-containing protein [Xenococcaceae cyanobacterium]